MVNFISLLSNIIPFKFGAEFVLLGVVMVCLVIYIALYRGFIMTLNSSQNQVKMFFSSLVIIILVSEFIQIYYYQDKTYLKVLPIFVAVVSLLIVFKYSYFIRKKVLMENILVSVFFLYQINVLAKIYFNGNNLVFFGTIIIIFYAAAIVIKNTFLYISNVFFVFIYLFLLLELNKIPSYDFYVLIACILGVIIISYGKRLSLLTTVKDLEFSKELMNNSSTLLCAFDKYGSLKYVNEAITNMLGYTANEVKGKQFWVLTQDPDYIDIDYNEMYQQDRTYVRKLTSKSGKFHYILWTEKKINNNLFVSSGQDITHSFLQEQEYKTLFDSVSEIVYEADKHGKFTRINTYAEKIFGYGKNELKGVDFKDLIFKDDIKIVKEHYKRVSNIITNFKPLEFRVLVKGGGYIWVSQIVNVKLNDNGKIYGFTAIARVITEEKQKQLEQNANILKNIEYQNLINKLYTTKLSEVDIIENIKLIIDESSSVLKIDRVSIWKYNDKGIKLEYNHFNDNGLIEGQLINKQEFPKYFESMLKNNSLIVNDVESNPNTHELYDYYFKPNGIKSLIDHIIKINGKIDRIICFEEDHYRNWNDDEIRFTQTIANYLALIIERNEKSKIEYLLQKKGALLSSLNSINHELTKCSTFIDILNCNYNSLGELLKVSRLFFFENKRSSNYYNLKYRWLNNNVQEKTGMHNFSIFNINDYPEIQNQFKEQGYFYENRSNNLSESLTQLFDEIKIKTLLLLPLYLDGNLFGFIGLDDSEKNKSWQKEDIDIFISFAKNLESVIEKNIEK